MSYVRGNTAGGRWRARALLTSVTALAVVVAGIAFGGAAHADPPGRAAKIKPFSNSDCLMKSRNGSAVITSSTCGSDSVWIIEERVPAKDGHQRLIKLYNRDGNTCLAAGYSDYLVRSVSCNSSDDQHWEVHDKPGKFMLKSWGDFTQRGWHTCLTWGLPNTNYVKLQDCNSGSGQMWKAPSA